MKKLENFLSDSICLKEKSKMILGGTATGGYSRPSAGSATGCITFNSDTLNGDGTVTGHDGHENPMR